MPANLLEQIREEVRDVKGCFTNFTFQGAALAAVAAGFILSGLKDNQWLSLAAAPVIFVLMLVCRVGIFKYTTANRNLGYELHLDRLKAYERLGDPAITARVERLRIIGWEEALRAWRVVQASVFAQLYSVPQIRGDRMWLLRWMPWTEWFDPSLYKEKPLPPSPLDEKTLRDPNDFGPLSEMAPTLGGTRRD